MTPYGGASTLDPIFVPPSVLFSSTTVSCAVEMCFVDTAKAWLHIHKADTTWVTYSTNRWISLVTSSAFYPMKSFNCGSKTSRMKSFLTDSLASCSLLMPQTLGWGGQGGAMESFVKRPCTINSSFSASHPHHYDMSACYAPDWAEHNM